MQRGSIMDENILLSKLIPPEPAAHYMRRARVMKKLSNSHNAKLTILHSGAGFGKSSALAQFLADQSIAYSWYQVTADDDDILPFLRHLFYSVRRVIPSFGDQMKGWDQLSTVPKTEELNKLYIMFANEFCKIREPFFVVLDDYYLVDHIYQIHFIMEKLILHLPSNVHLIVSSRIYPSWNCLRNLRLTNQLVECVEADFVFSTEEIQVFFEDYFEQSITEEQVKQISKATDGWAIAILFLATRTNNLEKSIDKLQSPKTSDIFHYLSDEVFESLEEFEKEVTLKFSIFETFSHKVIEEFYGKNFSEVLTKLVKKHSFIQPLSGYSEFRYHVLFQQFLELKMMEQNIDEFNRLHYNATIFFTKKQNAIQAVYHAMKTKNEDIIAKTIIRFASQFLEEGKYDWLIEKIRELSKDTMVQNFQLYYFVGESQRFRAQYKKARTAYEKCLEFAKRHENYELMLRAKIGLAHIYLDTIQPSLAEGYLQEALDLAEHTQIEKEQLQFIQKQYAENLVNLGKPFEAEQWIEEVGLSTEILLHGNLDVRILLRQGKFQQAKKLIETRLDSSGVRLDAYRETDVLYSFILTLLGENKGALEIANKSIIKKDNQFSQYHLSIAYLRKGHTLLVLNPYNVLDAEKYYLKSIEIMDNLQVNRAKAESYMGLAIVKSRQYHFEDGIMFAKLGLEETERVHDHWVSALLYTALTIIYVEHGQLKEAKKAISLAKGKFSDADYFGIIIVNFWSAYIAYLEKDDQVFLNTFKDCISILMEQKYEFFITAQHIFGPVQSLVWWKMVDHWKRLQDTDTSAPLMIKVYQLLEVDTSLAVPTYVYKIQLLGKVTIFRDNHEIDEKSWQREKAKELFLYLYMNHSRFVSKEEIVNALWPKTTDQASLRDFKVVYNALLKVLEPNRLPRSESAYIIRKQSMYKLVTEHCITSDYISFKKFIHYGIEEMNPTFSNEWLMRGIQLYTGELIADKPYLYWVQNFREEAKQLYMEAVERVAQNFVRLKEFNKTIYWAEHLLKMDNTWEEAYRLIMYGYYQLHNRAQAVKWFEKCERILKKELNIEPMETTVQMYDMILK